MAGEIESLVTAHDGAHIVYFYRGEPGKVERNERGMIKRDGTVHMSEAEVAKNSPAVLNSWDRWRD